MRNYFNDNVACEDLMALFQNGVKVFSLPPCLQREKYALFYIALDKRQCTELFLSSVNWKKFRRSVRRFEISLRWLSKRDVWKREMFEMRNVWEGGDVRERDVWNRVINRERGMLEIEGCSRYRDDVYIGMF